MKKDSSELLTTVKKEARRVAGALEHAAESLLGTKPGQAAKKAVKKAATRVKRREEGSPGPGEREEGGKVRRQAREETGAQGGKEGTSSLNVLGQNGARSEVPRSHRRGNQGTRFARP